MSSKGALILVSVDTEAVRSVLRGLDPKKQNTVLKKALKQTSEQARKRLAEKAQGSYTVKNAGFKKAMRIRVSGTSARILAEGEPLSLEKFRHRTSKSGVKVQVVKSGGLKSIISQRNGTKAFLNNIAKKGQTRKKSTRKGAVGSAVRHIAIAQRRSHARLTINEKFSNSIPAMIGSEKHVYGMVEPYIAEDLQENLRKFVDEALGKGNA